MIDSSYAPGDSAGNYDEVVVDLTFTPVNSHKGSEQLSCLPTASANFLLIVDSFIQGLGKYRGTIHYLGKTFMVRTQPIKLLGGGLWSIGSA